MPKPEVQRTFFRFFCAGQAVVPIFISVVLSILLSVNRAQCELKCKGGPSNSGKFDQTERAAGIPRKDFLSEISLDWFPNQHINIPVEHSPQNVKHTRI